MTGVGREGGEKESRTMGCSIDVRTDGATFRRSKIYQLVSSHVLHLTG